MKRLLGTILIGAMLMLCACHEVEEAESSNLMEEMPKADVLNVFVVGDFVKMVSENEESNEQENNDFYTTMISLGEYNGNAVKPGEEGFLYYDAFKSFEEETGIKLQVHWFTYPELMEEEWNNLKEEEKPDIILSNATSRDADYYLYMKQNKFQDISTYAMDEGLYNNDLYYEEILQAGRFEEKQYILPLLFNIDTIMGSESTLNRIELYLYNAENHSEVIDMLVDAQKKEQINEVVSQYVSGMTNYTPYILYDAAGEKWIDYETGIASLDKKTFEEMGMFYKAFLEEQFGDLSEFESFPWAYSKHMEIWRITGDYAGYVPITDVLMDKGCIVEGGGSFQTHLHSAAAQARYYESRYNDNNENFVLMALPDTNGRTTAHVTYFGGVTAECEYPADAYHFLRYLMDQETFYQVGLSVNREITKKQLDIMESEEFTIYPGLQMGNEFMEDVAYTMKPMSKETRNKIDTMLHNIGTVGLPDWPVYSIIQKQLESYCKSEKNIEEAYSTALEELQDYIE